MPSFSTSLLSKPFRPLFLLNGVKQTGEMTILPYGGIRLSAMRSGEVQARLPRRHGQEEGDGGELQQWHEP